MRHLLLTNDFPPKVGGIQSYLWELWRRLPADEVTVLTASSHSDARAWDASQPFEVVRSRLPVLLPHPGLAGQVRRQALARGARSVVVDPALPLGLVGPHLGLPYGLVLHGAEVTVPGRLPVSRRLLARAVAGAGLVVAAGAYPEAEARRAAGDSGRFPLVAQVPPGVDTDRFRPPRPGEADAARSRWDIAPGAPVVLSTSRLVPRKGVDTLLLAAAAVAPEVPGLTVLVGSSGRDRSRLERLAAHARAQGAVVRFVGRVADAELPSLYWAADVFALCCRSRWWGLEAEGFGIVLLEAAASGLPCVTVDSGGAGEAVEDHATGYVVRGVDHTPAWWAPGPARAPQVAGVETALRRLLARPEQAKKMGEQGRQRAVQLFSYDRLAAKLGEALGALA